MNTSAYLTLRDEVVLALKEHRLADMLAALDGQLTFAGSWTYKQTLQQMRTDYELLLVYFKQGATDPTRHNQVSRLLRMGYEISESIHCEYILEKSGLHRAVVWRALQKMELQPTLEGALNGQYDYQTLFDVVWTAPAWSDEQEQEALLFLQSSDQPDYLKIVLVSAVIMSLLASFDGHRVQFLLQMLRWEFPQELYDRALVGVVFAVLMHADVVGLYPDIVSELSALAKVDRYREQLSKLQRYFLAIVETSRFSKHIADGARSTLSILFKLVDAEVEGHEVGQTLFEEARLLLNEHTDADLKIYLQKGEKGEQQLEFDASALKKTLLSPLMNLSKMVECGVDTSFDFFKKLMSHLPFFQIEANWFSLFAVEHPVVQSLSVDTDDRLKFAQSRASNTDLFAIAHMISEAKNQVPEEHAQVSSDGKEGPTNGDQSFADDDQPMEWIAIPRDEDSADVDEGEASNRVLRGVVQDFYRFFQLFPFRNERENPFKLNLFLYDSPFFREPLSNVSDLASVAAHCMVIGDYTHAEHLLLQLPSNTQTVKQLAECYEAQEKWADCVLLYEQQLLQEANDKWLLEHLLKAHLMLENYDEALVLIYRLYGDFPDSENMLLQISVCFYALELYHDAAERLQKVLYNQPKHKLARRLLGWTYLMLERFDEASQLYDELLAEKPRFSDFINAGHAAWLQGDVSAATILYREAMKRRKIDLASQVFFDEDREKLLKLGLSDEDLRLMIDLLNTEE